MRQLLIVLLLIAILVGCTSNQQLTSQPKVTTFILVRHAEKIITNETDDPLLTEKGMLRAQKLAEVLSEVNIDAIYSSQYQRAILTVEPIATQKSRSINYYDTGKLHDFAEQLMAKHQGHTVLISGHSNTTPDLIGILSGTDQKHLSDAEYDWLFILDIADGGPFSLKKLKIEL